MPAWCTSACKKEAMGRGGQEKKKVAPLPEQRGYFPLIHTGSSRQGDDKYPERRKSHHRPSNLQKGLPCKTPQKTLYPKSNKRKKRHCFHSPTPSFFRGSLDIWFPVRAAKHSFGDIRKNSRIRNPDPEEKLRKRSDQRHRCKS